MQMTTGSLKRIGHDAVGFRVRGVCGTQFRQWANAHLSEYIVRGHDIRRKEEARLADEADMEELRRIEDETKRRGKEGEFQ